MTMINTKTRAENGLGDVIKLRNTDGDCVATFSSDAFFYIVTGFKTVEAYNEHQAEEPTKFLMWNRQH